MKPQTDSQSQHMVFYSGRHKKQYFAGSKRVMKRIAAKVSRAETSGTSFPANPRHLETKKAA